MLQRKGQAIVYSSQLDDGLLHHHPVAVLESSRAPVTGQAAQQEWPISHSLWHRCQGLCPAYQGLSSLSAVSAVTVPRPPGSGVDKCWGTSGLGENKATPPGLPPRTQVQQHTARPVSPLKPRCVQVPPGHSPPPQTATSSQDQAPARLESQTSREIPSPSASGGSRQPHRPLPRRSRSPARPRCPGDSRT